MIRAELAFASPRKLPKPSGVNGKVVVVDVAFASEASGGGFEKITKPFIEGLGTRLAAWVDEIGGLDALAKITRPLPDATQIEAEAKKAGIAAPRMPRR